MAEFVGPEGGHFIDGDDLDHIRTVRRWVDCDGNSHSKEFVTPFATFVAWNNRANAIIAEVIRRRAEAHIATLPHRRKTGG